MRSSTRHPQQQSLFHPAVVGLLIAALLISASFIQTTTAQKGGRRESKPVQIDSQSLYKYDQSNVSQSAKLEGDGLTRSSDVFEVPLSNLKGGKRARGQADLGIAPNLVATADLGREVEPNGTSATANPLNSSGAKIKGNILPNGDIDFFSFSAASGDRVYASTMTSASASASVDSVLDLIGTDGTTILETDLDDGSFGTTSSSIAGFTIPSAGTYFLRVRHNVATTQIRPYDLYFTLQTGSPTAETEPNDSFPGQALPASGWVSGSTSATTDLDFYSISLNAGDTVFLSLDLDPERDTTEWNAQLGFGSFGTPPVILVVNDAGAATPDSESFFMTVQTAGTYGILVGLPAGGSTFGTYNLSVSVLPQVNRGINCTTYTSTNVPVTIPTGPGVVTSTLTVPGSPRIESMRVKLNLTHNFMADLDVELTSPTGNTIGLFTDVGSVTAGVQTTMDTTLDDNAGIPIGQFTIVQGPTFQPELNYRLDWFHGQPAGGTWTLTIRDDAAADGGTLNGWGLEICEPPPAPSCAGTPTTVFSTDFESGDAGFTHSGTSDEWERGTPTFAPLTTCNSGTNCWKTDLDNTYNASSSQDLLSPNINLSGLGGPIILSWAQMFQIESATFDHAFVEVREVGNPSNALKVYEWSGATMTNTVGNPTVTTQEAGGWGIYTANISAFSGLNVEVRFHLDSDTSVQLAGLAIDDVSVTACQGTPAMPGQLLISEFRTEGPNGVSDEFIEIYNNTGVDHTVSAASGTGYGIAASDGVTRCLIPNGTVIPAGGHYLCVNSAGYSLASYPAGNGTTATGDATYTTEIPINTGIAIFNNNTGGGSYSLANRIDAVGSTSEANTLYREGAGYPPVTVGPPGIFSGDHSFYRDDCGKQGSITNPALCTRGVPGDSDNNAIDFVWVDTNGLSAGAGQRLGAPSPQNLSSPIQRNSTIKASLLDPCVSSASSPNRVRDLTPVTNGSQGTVDIRRTFTNNTGTSVTRLRFRIVDITTFPAPSGIAELRVLTSPDIVVTVDRPPCGSGTSNVTVRGLTLEQPPNQTNGGAFNSSWSAGTITLATPLAAGASIDLHFFAGVQQTGTFRLFLNVEALP